MTFEEEQGKTKLTLRHTAPGAPATEIDGARQGWTESLDRLEAYLAKA